MKKTALIVCGLALAAATAGYIYRAPLQAKLVPGDAKQDVAKSTESKSGGARSGSRRGPREVPVLIGKVAVKKAPRRLSAIGAAQAFSTVAVKSRVDGQITEAFFKEGQPVAKGDLLFRIDARPLEVALRQARANLERDRAQVRKAQGDVTRYKSLVGKGFASQQKYEEAHANFDALQGVIRAGEEAIAAAKLQLEYTAIRSPIDGRTGSILVNAGNLVKANDSQPLVVITQLRPIFVTFSVPERYLSQIKKLMAAGQVPVEAKLPGPDSAAMQGHLVFVNNAVDTNTGTIQLKAEFDNSATELTAGQFVNVSLTLEARDKALVIPSQAIQEGQRGSFVFVMKENKTVDMRPVTVDDTVGDVTVIAKGLVEGETVVLDGQLLLRPGAKVSPKAEGGAVAGGSGKGRPRDGEKRNKRRMKEGS